MSTTTPGSSRPDPTRPILVGTQVPAPPAPPAQPGPRQRGGLITGLIVAVVVLAVAVLGVGGWAVVRPYLGAPGQTGTPVTTGPVTTPVTTGPATASPTTQPVPPPSTGTVPGTPDPTVVPFDVRQDLSIDPQSSDLVLGVWDGVAVFLLGNTGLGGHPNILRGVEVATGDVLWTLDTTPGGAEFEWLPWAGWLGTGEFAAGVYSAGTIAVQVGEAPYRGQPEPGVTPECPGRETVLLVSLRSGTASAVGSWESTCTNGPGSEMVSAPRLTAFHDGIVILTGETDRDSADGPGGRRPILTTTSAYAVTDLTRPVWSVNGTVADSGEGGSPGYGAWGPAGPVVMGRWVASVAGEYVDLYTGAPTGLTYTSWSGDGLGPYVLSAGGRLYTRNGVEPGHQALSLWSSPTATGPVWTYTIPPGSLSTGQWWNGGSTRVWSCQSEDIGILAALPDDVRAEDGTYAATDVTAVNLGTGAALWSQRYAAVGVGECALIARGDQEIVAVATGTAVEFRDAATGRLLAPEVTWADVMGGPSAVVDLRPCGQGLVCAVTDGGMGSGYGVLGLYYEDGTVTLGGITAMPNWGVGVWETNTGPLIVGTDYRGTGKFIF